MSPSERDPLHLEIMLELIEHLHRRLAGATEAEFLGNRDEVDLTAFRLAVLAGQSGKLSAELKARHPALPWRPMMDLGNLVSHDYDAIIPERILHAVTLNLVEVEAMCRAELAANP